MATRKNKDDAPELRKSKKAENLAHMGLKETGKRMRSGFWSDEHFPIKDVIIADDPSDPFFHFTDERHGQLDAEWARSVAQKQVTPVVASQRLRGGKIVTLIVDGRCRKLARELHGCPTISVVIDNRLTDMEVASAILESFRRRPMLLADRVQQVCKVFRAALAQQGVEGRKPNEQLAAKFVAEKLGENTTAADVMRLVEIPKLHQEAQRLFYGGYPLKHVDSFKELLPEAQAVAAERALTKKDRGTKGDAKGDDGEEADASADEEAGPNQPKDPTEGLETRERLRRRPAQEWHALRETAVTYLEKPPEDASPEQIARVAATAWVCEWWAGKGELADLLAQLHLRRPATKTVKHGKVVPVEHDLKTAGGRFAYDKACWQELENKGARSAEFVKQAVGGTLMQVRTALARLATAGHVRVTNQESNPLYEATSKQPEVEVNPVEAAILRCVEDAERRHLAGSVPGKSRHTAASLAEATATDIKLVKSTLRRLVNDGMLVIGGGNRRSAYYVIADDVANVTRKQTELSIESQVGDELTDDERDGGDERDGDDERDGGERDVLYDEDDDYDCHLDQSERGVDDTEV